MRLIEIMNQNNPEQSPSAEQKIEFARTQIFQFNYPFFDETKKAEFETKFLMHFYTRQLGLETPALWIFYLNETLNRIMPYYNEWFKSQLLQWEPFQDILIEETFTKDFSSTKTGEGNSSSESTGKYDGTSKKTGTDTTENTHSDTGKDTLKKTGTESTETEGNQSGSESHTKKYSDTPQGLLNNLDYLTNLTQDSGSNSQNSSANSTVTYNTTDTKDSTDSGTAKSTTTYNSTVTDNQTTSGSESTSSTTNGTEKALENYMRSKKGMSGKWSYADLVQKLRGTFVNVYNMIFNSMDVQSLFILFEDI